jgi:hypothetical protein
MKTLWLGLALAIVSVQTSAQVGEWHDADVIEKTSITNPAKAVKDTEGQWLAFSMPVLEGTRSPCCWKGRWNGKGPGMGEVGCRLDRQEQVARLDEHSVALYAFALPRSTKAGKRLYSLAKETDSDVSEEAIFWLGDAHTLTKAYGSIMPLMVKNSMAAINADAGTVITQAAAILFNADLLTSSCR